MSTTVQITTPFAFDGTRTPIDTVRTDGVVNMTQGYTADYSRALGADPAAKAVDRDRFNWLMYLMTANGQDWQLHGLPQWLAQGQYEIGSLVRYTPGTVAEKLYRCTATPPVGSVPTNTQYWEEIMDNTTIQALVPMPYRGQIAVATNFNTLSTNGTWVFNSAAVVSGSANSPSGAGAGMLETRLTGAADGTAIQRYTGINGSIYLRGRTGANTWSEWATSNFPISIAQGGTGATTAAQARTNLGLGTAAVRDIGTTGDTVPLFSGINTWTGEQIFRSSGGTRVQGFGGANNYGRLYFGTGAAFLEYDAAKFAVGNPVNGQYTIIAGGGTTWTSATFNPDTKVNVDGDQVITGFKRFNTASGVGFGNPGRAFDAGLLYETVDGNFGVRAANANGSQTAFFRFDYNGTFNVLNGAMKASKALYCTNRMYAVAGASSGDFPVAGAAGIEMSAANVGQVFAYNYGTAAYLPMEYNASAHRFANGPISSAAGYDFGSSRKLKIVDGEVPYGLDEVEQMELASGHYKKEYNADGRRRLFLIAEQLAELVPEAVDLEGVEFDGEKVPSIKIDQLLPVLVRSIQQLSAKVRALEGGA